MGEESVKYRAKFTGRPDLDSSDFMDYAGRIELEVNRLEVEAGGEK